ncbi:hypothetical protein P3X46_012136 [Hevea brasiliensis]|uniref:DUF4283 domain-containing protein n=1 Tax=Hevea brasiliensis TaxID=3981 RepID=A0ABQ9M9A3_HEVBR|nr:hypothetical protein P3X46_012136 [Hevea brasiliensis]
MEANMATLVLSTDEDEVLKVDVDSEKIIKESYDLYLVVEGGPWAFNNHLLILHQLKEGEDPLKVLLHYKDFWIQIYDLLNGFMCEEVAMQLGDFIGTYMAYDPNNNIGLWRKYMRIQVRIDVRKPLK